MLALFNEKSAKSASSKGFTYDEHNRNEVVDASSQGLGFSWYGTAKNAKIAKVKKLKLFYGLIP